MWIADIPPISFCYSSLMHKTKHFALADVFFSLFLFALAAHAQTVPVTGLLLATQFTIQLPVMLVSFTEVLQMEFGIMLLLSAAAPR